jgi:hypothetical protein
LLYYRIWEGRYETGSGGVDEIMFLRDNSATSPY